MNRAIVVLIAIAASCAPRGLAAYVYWECDGRALRWRSANPVVLRHSSISFPNGHPYTFSLGTAVSAWNLNPSGQGVMMSGPNPAPTVTIGDLRNDIWFSSDEDLVGGARAVTFPAYDCDRGAIVEADIVFNINEDWTSSDSKLWLAPYGGPYDSFASVAVHELGHLYGLDHDDRTYTVMLSWAHFHTNGATANPYPGEDASRGVVFLYGTAANRRQDVATTHWKLIWIDGIGGTGHFRTVLYPYETSDWRELLDPVDGFVAWRDNESEPIFRVYSGATAWAEFTYENLGADVQTVGMSFYLSDDDRITTADRRLNGYSLTLSPDVAYTRTLAANLPNTLVEGRDYFLGPLLDRGNSLAEPLGEGNNTTYTRIRVLPTRPGSFVFTPGWLDGGRPVLARVVLQGAAPGGGVDVALSTTDPYVTLPATVHVPGGAMSADFEIGTVQLAGTGMQRVTITGRRVGVPGVASGDFYVRRTPGDPDRTYCEVHPTAPICQLCAANPTSPLCPGVLQTADSEYRAPEPR